MAKKVTLPNGRVLYYPESMSDDEIRAKVAEEMEPKTDFGMALKHGFWGGIAELPETAGGFFGLVEDLIPGKQESIEGIEQKLKGYAEDVRAKGGEEQPDTFLEKVASGLAAAPGALGSMAIPVAATAGLGPLAGPAAGFGLYGAIRHGGEGLPQSIGQGLRGAAEGLAFGGMGKVASKVGGKAAREILEEIPEATKKLDIKQLKDILTRAEAAAEPHQLARRVAHAGGAGGVVTGAGLLSGEELEDALAGGAAMGLLGGAMHKGKFSDPALTRGKKIRDLWEGLKKEQDILTKGSAREAEAFPDPIKPRSMDERFDELADLQRGAPESAMLRVTRRMQGGLYGHILEHAGDLTHRMSQKPSFFEGTFLNVKEKVDRVHRALHREYGFEREVGEQLRANAEYDYGGAKPEPYESFRKDVDRMALDYANEHRKLPVYNRMQEAARDLAVALGEQRWGDARKLSSELKSHIDKGSEHWEKVALEDSGIPFGFSGMAGKPKPKTKIDKEAEDLIGLMGDTGTLSDMVHVLYGKDPRFGLSYEFNDINVSQRAIDQAKTGIAEHSRSMLRGAGHPEKITVYRGDKGPLKTDGTISVTLDKGVAKRHSKYGPSESGVVREFEIDINDVLSYGEIAKGTFAEQEIIVNASRLRERTSPIQDKYTREFSNPYGELPSARKVVADKFPEREPRIQYDEKYVAEIERDINLDQATHERHTPRQKIDIANAREYDGEAAVEATANRIGTRTIAGTRARGQDPHNVRINQLTGEVRVRGGHEDAALMEFQKLENGLEDHLATNYKEMLRAEALGDSAKVTELKIEQKENTALYQALKQEVMGIKSMGSGILRTAGQKDLKAKQKAKVDKLLGEVANLSDLTNDIMKWANGDPATFRGLARALKEPTGFDYAYEYWINGLLSGFPTHATNVISNAAVQLLSVAERTGKVPIDVARARLTGTPQQHHMSDLYGDFMGAKIGVKKALYIAGKAMRNENYEGEEFYLRRSRDKLDYKGQAFEGLAGTIIRAPSRFLYGMDMFFKTIAAEREGWSEAYRIAGGDAAKAQKIMYEEVPLGKTKQAKQILSMMKKAGEDQTFTTPPDKVSTQMLKMRELDIGGVKPVAIVVPFLNTPWNIIKYAWKRSPLFTGTVVGRMKVYKEQTRKYKKGQIKEEEYLNISRKFNKDMSEYAAGIGITGLFFGLAKLGALTGGGPSDPVEKMNLLSTGWKPYSLHIGNQYISLQRIEPIGTLLGMAGDIAEYGDTPDEDKTGKLLASIKDNLTNKTFLYGIENLSKAWADPERFGPAYAKQMLGTASPALLGKMTQAIDPYSRKTDWGEYVHGVPEAIAGRTPGLSMALEQRSTALGEPSDRWSFGPLVDAPGITGKVARAASTMVSPIVWDKEKQATVAKEFDRLRDHEGIPPSMPPRKKHLKLAGAGGERIELSSEEYKVYDKYHAMAEDHLEKLISGPGWAAVPDVYKAEQIRKVYKKYRKTANNVINMMIRRRAVEERK